MSKANMVLKAQMESKASRVFLATLVETVSMVAMETTESRDRKVTKVILDRTFLDSKPQKVIMVSRAKKETLVHKDAKAISAKLANPVKMEPKGRKVKRVRKVRRDKLQMKLV